MYDVGEHGEQTVRPVDPEDDGDEGGVDVDMDAIERDLLWALEVDEQAQPE